VRRTQGRHYSNEELLNTIQLCHRYHIPVTTFLSVGLAGETGETIKETWGLWDRLCSLDKLAFEKGNFGKDIDHRLPLGGPIIGPIILEPGSLSFDFPERYGYKLIFKTLEEYIKCLSEPSWHQWLSHETEQLNREELVKLILESLESSIYHRAKYSVYDELKTSRELLKSTADMIAVGVVNRIMYLEDGEEKEPRLRSLRDAMDHFLTSSPMENDPYGYREMLERISLRILSH
jgi:hypothetical protein